MEDKRGEKGNIKIRKPRGGDGGGEEPVKKSGATRLGMNIKWEKPKGTRSEWETTNKNQKKSSKTRGGKTWIVETRYYQTAK